MHWSVRQVKDGGDAKADSQTHEDCDNARCCQVDSNLQPIDATQHEDSVGKHDEEAYPHFDPVE